MSFGSLYAAPKNDKPTGNPRNSPAGTVMCGYPAIAAGEAMAEKANATLKASRTRQRGVNRGRLPAHLPREDEQ